MSIIDLAMVVQAARANGLAYQESLDDYGLTRAVYVETADGRLGFQRQAGGRIVARQWISHWPHNEVDPVAALIQVNRRYVQLLAAACVEYYTDPEKWSRFVTTEHAAQALTRWTHIAAAAASEQ